jgi:hypothetical protein
MSRSYRQPYYYWCGSGTIKQDRQIAARMFRKLENQKLRQLVKFGDYEDYLHPVQYEASWNDRLMWGCDSDRAYLYNFPNRYALTQLGLGDLEFFEDRLEFFKQIQRK